VETGLAASTILPGWWSAQREMQPVAGTQYYRIRNRYRRTYLHVEYGSLQPGTISSAWHGAMWRSQDTGVTAP
jgi:hypothetical protein